MKKIVLMFLTVMALWGGICLESFADESEEINEEFWEMFRGTTARNFTTESERVLNEKEQSINPLTLKTLEAIYVENEDITLEETGRVDFIDAIAGFSDNTYENIAAIAEWTSSNSEIVSVYAGQIIAGNKGTAVVTVCYQGLQKEINVTVETTIDVAAKIEEILDAQETVTPYNMSAAQRDSAVSIAKGMVEVQWTPIVNLTGWKGAIFPAGKTVTGVAYSQTEYQKDKDGFLNSLSYSDFYSSYTRTLNNKETIMPKYGNDCSGFVSYAWGVSRNTTTGFLRDLKAGIYLAVGGAYYRISDTYSIVNYDDILMKTTFASIQKGDALLKSGHMFLAAANSAYGEVVYVYEQTPNSARYTSYTYDTLAEAGYVPFCK